MKIHSSTDKQDPLPEVVPADKEDDDDDDDTALLFRPLATPREVVQQSRLVPCLLSSPTSSL